MGVEFRYDFLLRPQNHQERRIKLPKKNESNIDNLIEKIVKKDYNNTLEKVLEKKSFSENTKSILLSILYKIETSYKDYKKVKQNVLTKDELIENVINEIQENCNEIILVTPNSEQNKILGNKTFLVEKNKKRIVCQNIERKVLYCISKISKRNMIIQDKYFLINETLSDLINTGNNINSVEPLRDFNGYSWTTITREIESVNHNLIYQNLILLVGNVFMEDWINNKEIMIDYMEKFTDKLNEQYGKELTEEFIKLLEKISVFMEIKYNQKNKKRYLELKDDIQSKLEKMTDNKTFVENVTKEKKKLTKEIKKIDETINNKDLLQEEYVKRNEKLSLEEKIFSMRILAQIMADERNEYLEEFNKLNELLKPKQYVKIKNELEKKNKYLKLIEVENIDKEIEKTKLEIQKVFLKCLEIKLEKCTTKSEIIKFIYEYRYYSMLPYSYENSIYEEKNLKKEYHDIEIKILNKAHKLKVIEKLSKQEEFDYQLLKYIFQNRSINLEELQVKLIKEKNKENKNIKYMVQIFDGNNTEEKVELENSGKLVNKDLAIRFNKKVKVFC